MKQMVSVLVAVAGLAGALAPMAPAAGQADGTTAPIYGIKLPPDTVTGG
jgi:hypothetical protein